MQYTAHYFEGLLGTLHPLYSVAVPGETIEEARAAAVVLLATVHGAMGFRLCDGADRQVDIYVPVDLLHHG